MMLLHDVLPMIGLFYMHQSLVGINLPQAGGHPRIFIATTSHSLLKAAAREAQRRCSSAHKLCRPLHLGTLATHLQPRRADALY